jgi:hypothetical protein
MREGRLSVHNSDPWARDSPLATANLANYLASASAFWLESPVLTDWLSAPRYRDFLGTVLPELPEDARSRSFHTTEFQHTVRKTYGSG